VKPSAPLRIAHIDTGLTLRGGQRQLLLLARGLRVHGHEQRIVCPEASELCARARAEGFSVLALPQGDFRHLRGTWQLRRRVLQDNLIVLHAHDGAGQTISWLASLGTGVRRVASRRVTYLPRRRIDYRLKYKYTCHAVIAVSQFIGEILRSTGVPDEMINVIPDGIEIPEHLPDAAARLATRAKWGLIGREFVVGHLGNISPEKGQDIAVRASEILATQFPEAKLVLGGSVTADDLGRLGLAAAVSSGRVLLAGYQENLFEFFSGLDLYIMPSRSEGLGSSALLAMAHGLPVIATKVGGLPEIVEEGKTGWLIAPESPKALANAIAAAAADPARLREMSINARERAKQFSAQAMVERTEALYNRLIGFPADHRAAIAD